LDNILLAQKNLEIVLKNPCITFLPIKIYKAQKEIAVEKGDRNFEKKLNDVLSGTPAYQFNDFFTQDDFSQFTRTFRVAKPITKDSPNLVETVNLESLVEFAANDAEKNAIIAAQKDPKKFVNLQGNELKQYLNERPDLKRVVYRGYNNFQQEVTLDKYRDEAYAKVIPNMLDRYQSIRTLTNTEMDLSLTDQKKLTPFQQMEYIAMQKAVPRRRTQGEGYLKNSNLHLLDIVPLTNMMKGTDTDDQHGRANKPLSQKHLLQGDYSGIEFMGFTLRDGEWVAMGQLVDLTGAGVAEGYVTYRTEENMTEQFYKSMGEENPAYFANLVETMLKASELDSPDGKANWEASGMFGPGVGVKIKKGLSPSGIQYSADLTFKDGSNQTLESTNIFDFSLQLQNISGAAYGATYGREASQFTADEKVRNRTNLEQLLPSYINHTSLTSLVSPEFAKGMDISDRTAFLRQSLMNIFRKESAGTFDPSVKHSKGTALGIFQELAAYRTDMSNQQYVALGQEGQLNRLLEKRIRPNSSKINDEVDLYLTVFMPGALNNPSITTFRHLLGMDGDPVKRWEKNAWKDNYDIDEPYRPALKKWLKN
jgi:hypothetical protein